MSELSDDIARGCLENGEPIEARWGTGEWSREHEQQQEPDPWEEALAAVERSAYLKALDDVYETVKSMASELLALRADAETSQNHNATVIDPLVTQLRDAGYTGTLSEMVGQACALQEATRWIPVGEGVIPMDILLEIGNTKTGIVDVAVYGSISWQVREPTHYRLPVPPEGGE